MKKFLLLIQLQLISVLSFAQFYFYTLDFEDTVALHHLRIDTAFNPNNIWQVGAPQKTIFKNAYSSPNVIITDTINPYPINDTSSFTIVNVAGYGYTAPHTASLQGKYAVNSDTLTDFGTIAFSPDNGTSWYDIINDTFITKHIFFPQHWISLTGNSNGWKSFNVNLAPLGSLFNIRLRDTILWKFTFISDSIQTNKDGLMFDDLHFVDYAEGIEENYCNSLLSVFPNPTANYVTIKVPGSGQIQIIADNGQLRYQNKITDKQTIDIKEFENGLYFVKYVNDNKYSLKKFIVQR